MTRRFLEYAARLAALVAITRARATSARTIRSIACARNLAMNAVAQPTIIVGELTERLMLGADGTPMLEDSDELIAAEAAGQKPELVGCGEVRFEVVDPNATELGLAVGAIDAATDPVLCLRVRFVRGADDPEALMGSLVRVNTRLGEGSGVDLWFDTMWTHADAQAPTPFGEPGEARVRCNAALDSVGPNEALLVQVIDPEAAFGAAA